MKKNKAIEPMSAAAMEIVAFERRQEGLAKLQLKKREITTAYLFEEIGKVKSMNFSRSQSELLTLVVLKRLKESGAYKELGMTWEQTCDFCGMKRRTVDEKLVDLRPFKDEMLAEFANFAGFDFNKIKLLGEVVTGGAAEIRGNTIVYDGREIAIQPGSEDEIQAVLDQIETKYKTDLDNAQADVRAKNKLLKSKEDVITKQEKDLRKFEKRAEGRGLSPEEDAFEGQMENLRVAFDGYLSRIQPDQIEELQAGEGKVITPRMRSLYLSTLEYMHMQITAARDTAVEQFGADLKESEWRPGK